MRGVFTAALAVMFWAAPSFAQRPDWVQDPYSGLGRERVLCGLGSSEQKPDDEITAAIAFAFAVKDISSMLSLKVSQLGKNYGEKTSSEGALAESATKNSMKSPFGFALFKTYASNDAAQTLTVLSVEVEEINDPDFQMFWQQYADTKKGEVYVRALVPLASARYLQFISAYGRTDAEILGKLLTADSVPGGGGKSRMDRLHSLSKELEGLRADMKLETERLRRLLGPEVTAWKQKGWKLYSRNLGRGSQAENELVLQSSDGATAWVEHHPTDGATLTARGMERNFVYDRSGGNWREKGCE